MQDLLLMTTAGDGGIVCNRAQFLAAVARRLAAPPAPFPDIAVLSIALPGMPAFRQTYGEPVSDQLLHRIYAAIHRFAPGTVLARLSDGLLAMTYELDTAWTSIEDVASDLRSVICGSSTGNQLALVSPANVGAVVHSGRAPPGGSLELAMTLLRHATLAVQMVPTLGSEGFMLYSPVEDERVRSVTRLDQSLRQAVAQHEFRLHYQPLVDLRTEETVGLEALVRWASPSAGLRSPQEFIPAAETSGLIVQIGAAVIDIAMRQVDAWISEGWTPPRVAVNVSAAQLIDRDFCSIIRRAVTSTQARAINLELEMTERTLIVWSHSTKRLLHELREMGVSLALDDFGTGFSSLQYLRQMPLTKLKIDRSFIRHIATNPRDAALVRTIVGLGEALDIDIVAEGIEHEAQLEVLRKCGCTIGQGYLFARPLPASLLPRRQSTRSAKPDKI